MIPLNQLLRGMGWRMKKIIAGVFVFFFLGITSGICEEEKWDGHSWNKLTKQNKIGFAIGFNLGVYNGVKILDRQQMMDSKFNNVSKSYDSKSFYNLMNRKELNTGATFGQTISGINTFYSDYRNLNIFIEDAYWVIQKDIAGFPEAERNATLLYLRNGKKDITLLKYKDANGYPKSAIWPY